MKLFFSLALLLAIAPLATAQTTATQDVTVTVQEINALSVSAATVALTINAATAGSNPTPVTSSATTYAITTNAAAKKITGQLSGNFASGITLKVQMAAPTGASTSQQTLSTTASNLVTGIARIAASALTITYTAEATAAAVPNAPTGETKTVTFTVTNN